MIVPSDERSPPRETLDEISLDRTSPSAGNLLRRIS